MEWEEIKMVVQLRHEMGVKEAIDYVLKQRGVKDGNIGKPE